MKLIAALIVVMTILNGCSEGPTSGQSGEFVQPYSQMLVYPKKNPIESFQLSRHDNQTFSEDSFKGRWNLLFMGYTNCPDVCPTTLMDLTNIYKQIDPQLQKKLQIIFLSVDPQRDNPAHMGDYIEHFHDDFVGITGDKNEIDKLVKTLGGIYSFTEQSDEFYLVDHTARIFIVNPAGERFGIIRSEAMHNSDKSQLIRELNVLAGS